MGNVFSASTDAANAPTRRESESELMEDVNTLHVNDESVDEQFHDSISDNEETVNRRRDEDMNEFRKQLDTKREQRRAILDRHRTEKKNLEIKLTEEKMTHINLCEKNKMLRELLVKNNIEIPEKLDSADEDSYIASSISERCDLAKSNNALQSAYSNIADLSEQNTESIKQVKALKEVINVSKTMINLREEQLNELKNKLSEIEQSLADRETSVLSTDLRKEYERQLQNIRTLRGLYEERARLAEVTRQALVRENEEHKVLLEVEINKSKNLTSKVEKLESEVATLGETIEDKNNVIASCQEETRGIKAEMLAVNKLFSQVLLGYKNKQDLDKLISRLEENHGILTHMAGKENSSELSSELPKLLLEIVSQIEESDNKSVDEKSDERDVISSLTTTPEEIVQNLPKVWRVLSELLSHQSEADSNTSEKVTTCYKSVQTKSGPVLVPSVSQTYIRLKDLILEKLALIKEVNRMKQLNTHLESRLGEQEKRLCLVTNELSKTWHVVGRLRRHHHQLHTHEKILKYELQQKRKLLNELKEELEYCREKWEQAREKNTQSEKDWRKLRTEFSNRKLKPDLQSLTNSAESGYSDERPSDESSESNDESEYAEPKVKCKKKFKKSFETIIDSSADFNLAAEREDPVSDMLDVAELPLDTHDDNIDCDASDSMNSESLCKEKVCDETEDEIPDIVNESCLKLTTDIHGENIDTASSGPSINIDGSIDPAPNIHDIEKYQQIHENGEKIVGKSHLVDKVIEPEDNMININLPSTSQNVDFQNNDIGGTLSVSTKNIVNTSESEQLTENSHVDFKAILENVRKQNERLEMKDKRLSNLEQGCSSVLEDMSNTLTVGDEMIAKLDNLRNPNKAALEEYNSNESNKVDSPDSDTESKPSSSTEEPSSSREIDHEARFAARDLRLKRLEEQTKSLVKKVNKTATKGVRINYKLEELHNIYGSEHSRSGTPSEDTEDMSQNDENSNE
ncbi:putative Ofd1 protein [Danaus plexippus plexippus]|uniref:Ofd1 protein n=1 Tax=Danaus plexippus plexippus TaxID=278856 RepID=A0A212F8V7_DANPL|nr:putative Ofd1 protein [Danaus plexippus plexippus]